MKVLNHHSFANKLAQSHKECLAIASFMAIMGNDMVEIMIEKHNRHPESWKKINYPEWTKLANNGNFSSYNKSLWENDDLWQEIMKIYQLIYFEDLKADLESKS